MLPPETTGVMAARAEIAAMIAVLDMMKGYLLGLTSRTSEAIRFLHVSSEALGAGFSVELFCDLQAAANRRLLRVWREHGLPADDRI